MAVVLFVKKMMISLILGSLFSVIRPGIASFEFLVKVLKFLEQGGL